MPHAYGSSPLIQALEGGDRESLEQDCYETAPHVWLCSAFYEKPCLKEKGERMFEESRHQSWPSTLRDTHVPTHI